MEPRKNTFSITYLAYACVQWTWGIAQNIAGSLLFLLLLRHEHFFFHGAIVTVWHSDYSVDCGMFIFLCDYGLTENSGETLRKRQYDTLVHEYGHSIQSILLGPFFMPVIGLPSSTWASLPCLQKLRKRKNLSYYWLYCEKWANHLGDKILKNNRLS